MSNDPAVRTEEAEQERHASWTELFFDLVVVAGVGMLAHMLVADLELKSLGLYVVLFLAFWIVWATFMLYGNIAAGNTHVMRLLAGMVGLGVMAAATPRIAHTFLEGSHNSTALNAFAIAYVVTRVYGSRAWARGQVLIDFPVVQHTLGVLPWIASFWVEGDWKIPLWAAGVAIDLLLIIVISGTEMLARYQAQLERFGRRSANRLSSPRREVDDITLVGVSTDPAHLAERLGLFVIIVLGEGLIQIIDAAAEADYGPGLMASGLSSFVLLAGMFGLSVIYGYGGLPHLRAGSLTVRAGLGLHCLVTATIASLSVALAAVVEHGTEPLPDAQRWLLCGALAAYFMVGLIASIISRGFRPTAAVVWIVTGVAVPLLIGLLAGTRSGTALVWYVALVVLGHLWFERRSLGRAAKTPSTHTAVS